MQATSRLVCVLAAGVLAVSLSAAPAQAATRVVHDKVGDSTAPNDVTRIRVFNGERRTRIAVHYRDLGPGHISAGITIDPRRQGGGRYFIFAR